MADEEVDLDWGSPDVEDPDAEEAMVSENRSRERTKLRYPTKPPHHANWGEYFAEIKRNDKARKAERAAARDELLSSADATIMPASPKAAKAAVDVMGWLVTAREWTVSHPDDFYAGDSKATGASAGDLKKAAHETRHLGILARKEGMRLGFYAEWRLGETPKGAPSAKWDHAIVVDPVGLPRELGYGYVIDKNQEKALGLSKEASEQITARRAADYNDGASWLARTIVFEQAGDLTTWLEDWQVIFVQGYERPVKKPKKPKQAELGAKELLAVGEWNG